MEVKEISKTEAKSLVTKYHYLKDKSFLYMKAYGLFSEDNTLVGAAVYSPLTGISSLKSWFNLTNDIFPFRTFTKTFKAN